MHSTFGLTHRGNLPAAKPNYGYNPQSPKVQFSIWYNNKGAGSSVQGIFLSRNRILK